jgi:hypothetical protein
VARSALRPGPLDRDAAIEVLGEPDSVFRLHEPKTSQASDGFTDIALAQILPEGEADEPAYAYEWRCGDAALGTACTAVESDGVFNLVVVCAMHAE